MQPPKSPVSSTILLPLLLPFVILLLLQQSTFCSAQNSNSNSNSVKTPTPKCPSLFAWIRDNNDCARFWRCNWGRALEMPRCPTGTVFSDRLHVCVYTRSYLNDCPSGSEPGGRDDTPRPTTPTPFPPTPSPPPTPSSTTESITVYTFCTRNLTGLKIHPTECQLFYNCSQENGVVPRTAEYEHYLQECPYPLLYDWRSRNCQQRWNVDCQGRKIPANVCEYRINTCIKPPTTPTTTTPRPVIPSPSSPIPPSVFAECSANFTALLPHSEECQLYYNCSAENGVVPRKTYEHYLEECAFPLLYDIRLQNCRQPWMVDCQQRRRPQNRCDYKINTCSNSSISEKTATSSSSPSPSYSFSIFEYCARNQTDLKPHPSECQTFYNCSRVYDTIPQSYEQYMQECAFPLLYDATLQRCADRYAVKCGERKLPNSQCDYRSSNCYTPPPSTAPPPTPPSPSFSITERCSRNRSALIPHPSECQAYYDCSRPYDKVPDNFEQYMRECNYPQLYDVHEQECRDFWLVDCGQRKTAVVACDYRQYRCADPDCTPCERVMPSCVGKGNGDRDTGNTLQWLTEYVTCRDNRTVRIAQCPIDKGLLVPMVFSPVSNKCVNMYEVPEDQGGLRPECVGQDRASYPLERPDLFYVCEGGVLTGVYRCPLHTPVFDDTQRACVAL